MTDPAPAALIDRLAAVELVLADVLATCGDTAADTVAAAREACAEARLTLAATNLATVLDPLQATAADITGRLWPHDTLDTFGLKLAEEAGEVARAILKRTNAHHAGDLDAVDEWTANLRTELAQTLVCLLKIAHHEGASLATELLEELALLRLRTPPGARP